MKKMLLLVIVVALASFASAQSTNAMGRRSVKSDTPLVLVHHVLKTMSNTNGSGFTANAGFTAVDAVNTVICPGTTGTCLIQAEQIVQLGNASGGRVALCFYVDGAAVNGCYFTGETLADGNYAQFATTQGSIPVPHGNHTVQSVVYVDNGAAGGYYNFNYSVYKP